MTPTHTNRVDVPSRIPHMSYDEKFCITTVTSLITRNWEPCSEAEKTVYTSAGTDHSPYYLGLYPDFDEAADDGEHVADDEQNIPAVDELHSVSPAHTAAQFVFEKLHILLIMEMEDDQEDEKLCYVLFEFT